MSTSWEKLDLGGEGEKIKLPSEGEFLPSFAQPGKNKMFFEGPLKLTLTFSFLFENFGSSCLDLFFFLGPGLCS